ncbi:MAG: cobalamin biosynthesis protein CbiM [Candidatus Omnitrophota bacterium]|nr:MAG: cobalamin biosynthesis protein CbiM [Candidatus Omnitrophota bacterium]
MHIPDGFLNTPVVISTWALSVSALSYSLKRTKEALKDKMVPLMGVVSAFIFAAQMLNFPVMGGTSGHLIGGVLAAVLLGPYAGSVVLACVFIVQCLIFQDGGLTALGANIFNMAIIGTMTGYIIYRMISNSLGGKKRGIIAGAIFASWASVVIASFVCAIELSISGTSPLNIVLPAMVGVHVLIGIGEAVITSLVLGFVLKVRPDLIYNIA